MTEEKICAYCHLPKPLTEFHLAPRNADGRHRWCKTCRRAYYQSKPKDPKSILYGNTSLAKDMKRLKKVQSVLTEKW